MYQEPIPGGLERDHSGTARLFVGVRVICLWYATMFSIVVFVLCQALALASDESKVDPVRQVGEVSFYIFNKSVDIPFVQVKYGVFLEPKDRVVKRQTYESLRVVFYYDGSVEK